MGDASHTQMSSHDQPWRKRTQRGHSGLDKRPRFLLSYFYSDTSIKQKQFCDYNFQLGVL